jgi:hypothetical protein
MQHDEHEPGAYVRKVTEQSMAYARDLLDENARLLSVLTSVEQEAALLMQHLATARQLLKENEELRSRASSVEKERECLEDTLARMRVETEAREHQLGELQNRLRALDADSQKFSEQFALLEQQNTALANLYVAAYRLNGTSRLQDVITALQEIIANLIGSEEMAIYEVDKTRSVLLLLGWLGIDPDVYRTIPLGKGIIGRAAVDGQRFLADGRTNGDRLLTEKNLTACIPLKLDGEVIGMIAVFRLLPQKPALQALDLELFDLLSSQAATSLYCTSVRRLARQFSTERPTDARKTKS